MKLDRLTAARLPCAETSYIGSLLIAAGSHVCGRIDVWIIGTVLFWLFHGGAIVYEEGLLKERYCVIRNMRLTPRILRACGVGGRRIFFDTAGCGQS